MNGEIVLVTEVVIGLEKGMAELMIEMIIIEGEVGTGLDLQEEAIAVVMEIPVVMVEDLVEGIDPLQ